MATFTLFNSFPAEIHSLILSSCPSNDQICLRLTCKYLYTLQRTHNKTPIPLTSIDNYNDTHLCGFERNPIPYVPYDHVHRRQCHAICRDAYNAVIAKDGKPPVRESHCTPQRWASHCECYAQKIQLHLRLRDWMPKRLSYCRTCKKYTRRGKAQGNRCYHGTRKIQTHEVHYWTHRSRKGAFGSHLWNKWFNNAAMNRYESRIQQGCDGKQRAQGDERYSLRTLLPKQVVSFEAR